MAKATYDESQLSGAERLRLRQNNSANFRQAMYDDAHERFMARREAFIRRNPNAVNSLERQSVLGRANQMEDEDRMREHEKEMVKEKNAGELAVAQEKRMGMKEQGADAAAQNKEAAIRAAEKQWNAQKDIAKTNAESEKHKATTQAEAQKDIAKTDAEAKKTVAKTQADAVVQTGEQKNGYTDENGVYHPGSDVEAAKVQGAAAVAAAREQRINAAQTQQNKEDIEREKLIQKNIAAMIKKDQYRGWTAEQLRAAAEKMTNVSQYDRSSKPGSLKVS